MFAYVNKGETAILQNDKVFIYRMASKTGYNSWLQNLYSGVHPLAVSKKLVTIVGYSEVRPLFVSQKLLKIAGYIN